MFLFRFRRYVCLCVLVFCLFCLKHLYSFPFKSVILFFSRTALLFFCFFLFFACSLSAPIYFGFYCSMRFESPFLLLLRSLCLVFFCCVRIASLRNVLGWMILLEWYYALVDGFRTRFVYYFRWSLDFLAIRFTDIFFLLLLCLVYGWIDFFNRKLFWFVFLLGFFFLLTLHLLLDSTWILLLWPFIILNSKTHTLIFR